MGIDRIHHWLSQFGYGQSTGIDLNEEYRGVLPSRDWKLKVHKKGWYQGDTVSVGIGQGYWVATPIQMVKALSTLLNNGRVKTPHLLYSLQQGNRVTRYQPPAQTAQIGDPNSPYWGIVRNGMYGMANLPNGTGYKLFHTAPYQIAPNPALASVQPEAKPDLQRQNDPGAAARSHLLYAVCALQKSRVAMALILENGGGDGVVAGPTARAILDHIFDPANAPQPAIRRKVNRS
ncbi:penicillin-binding transpeptidase domain-containing protein [Serratia marcescens]